MGGPYPNNDEQKTCVGHDIDAQGNPVDLAFFMYYVYKHRLCSGGSHLSEDKTACNCSTGDVWAKDQCATRDPNKPDPNKPPPPIPCCGNPIVPANASKIQIETDIKASGALGFDRYYHGDMLNIDEATVRLFGRHWVIPFDSKILQESVRINRGPNAVCFASAVDARSFCVDQSQKLTGLVVPDIVSVTRPNSGRHLFSMVNGVGTPDADINSRLTATTDSNNKIVWTYTDGDTEDVEKYSADGKLLSITSRAGTTRTLTYSSGTSNDTATARWPADAPVCGNVQSGALLPADRLLCVTDNWGRQIQFEYDTVGRIVKLIAPDNAVTTYQYDGASGGCVTPDDTNLACSANNLTGVTYPDGKQRIYHYNESAWINGGSYCRGSNVGNGFGVLPNVLTGITDENGVRFATWGYDCAGNAVMSQHAGGVEKVTIDYGFSAIQSAHYVKYFGGTNANPTISGATYAYGWEVGVPKYRGTYDRCAGCPPAKGQGYDGNGNLAGKSDWNNIVTTYDYDLTRNLEIRRTDAFNTSQPLTTTTSWHATYRLPAQVNEPLLRTTYAYDTKGNLLTKTTQATTDANGSQGANASVTGSPRVWTYTYNNVGQILTATGPRTDVVDQTIYTYDTKGNLSSMTNAAGHVTTYANYDGNGRVGQITDPNGLVTTLTYTPRGLLSQRVSNADGVSETTSYQYDGTGQMTKVTLPDNSSISYIYDDAHRLTRISDSLGNSINYTLDNMSNRINETVTDSSGNLTRQVSRVYDILNQLKTVTGAAQ
ncbi:hypothetical protein [Undibacterium sp. Ji49W]|uniref:hypothetical protein n=1 Tax=Undibacterium sp. Ji49W TaxID=3413040 RepID=UPI003BF03BD1